MRKAPNNGVIQMKEETMKLTNMMALAAAAVLLLTGCTPQNENHNGFFKGEAASDEVNKFCQVQTSNGARNDAMLYSYHFTGTHLNSLGRSKVLAMLDNCNDNCDPVTVHLVRCGEDDVLAEWLSEMRAATEETLAKVRELPDVPHDLAAAVGMGTNWAEAIEDIEWQDGEVLVIGSSSVGPVKRVFLGSRAAKIVRHSPVPVVVVPRAAAAELAAEATQT